MRTLPWCLVLLAACGPASLPPDAGTLDAGSIDAGTADAGTADAGDPRWATRIQPLLWARCGECHRADAGLAAFPESYGVLHQPSQLCTDVSVGGCVSIVLQAQAIEGTRCRTYIVEGFHREGWACLSAPEVEDVVGWIDGGMPER
jgi:hypothetical protein